MHEYYKRMLKALLYSISAEHKQPWSLGLANLPLSNNAFKNTYCNNTI